MAQRTSKPMPTSLRSAIEMDKAHALKHKRLNIERLAELLGTTPATLYKWIETDSMPLRMLVAWQHLTGSNNVMRYLASRESCVVIAIPSGRCPDADDVHALQATLTGSMGAYLSYLSRETDREVCLAKLSMGLESLAWHRANVEKADQPELEF